MTIELCFVLVTLIVCVTVLIWKCIDAYFNKCVNKANNLTEYWKGRYYGLAKAFDKALKTELKEVSLDKVAEFLLQNADRS